MNDKSLVNQAAELLKQVDDVLVDVGVASWPWTPFALLNEEELLELRRHELLVQLLDEDRKDWRLRIAQQLVILGGYEIERGILELAGSKYRLFGRLKYFRKMSDIAAFSKPFQKSIRGWDDDHPDWGALELYLIRRLLIDPQLLSNLNLIDIRRYLLQGTPEPAPKTRKKTRTRYRSMFLTEKQKEAWTLHERGLSYRQISHTMGCSISNAHKLVKRAKECITWMTSARSKAANTGVEDYDQRSGIKKSSDLR